jgi:hypothetical protein
MFGGVEFGFAGVDGRGVDGDRPTADSPQKLNIRPAAATGRRSGFRIVHFPSRLRVACLRHPWIQASCISGIPGKRWNGFSSIDFPAR